MNINIEEYTYRRDLNKLSLLNPNHIDSIALHHMAHPTHNLNQVTDWHLDGNKWSWCGYGYWIGFDGKIYEVRGHKYMNAGVMSHNGHIVSVGLQGDYSSGNPMPSAQYDSTVKLVHYLKSQLQNAKTVDVHSRWNYTTCAGKYFPLDYIKNDLKKYELQGVYITSNKVEIVEPVKEPIKEVVEKKEPVKEPENWKFNGINKLHEMGLLNSPDAWKEKIDEPMEVWAVMTILARIAEKSIK